MVGYARQIWGNTMRQQYINRSLVLAFGLAVVGIAVIVQMFRIQNSEAAKLFLSRGDLYAGEFRMFYPERGEIYDRQGHLLAGNRTVYEVGVSLDEMNPRVRNPESPSFIA